MKNSIPIRGLSILAVAGLAVGSYYVFKLRSERVALERTYSGRELASAEDSKCRDKVSRMGALVAQQQSRQWVPKILCIEQQLTVQELGSFMSQELEKDGYLYLGDVTQGNPLQFTYELDLSPILGTVSQGIQGVLGAIFKGLKPEEQKPSQDEIAYRDILAALIKHKMIRQMGYLKFQKNGPITLMFVQYVPISGDTRNAPELERQLLPLFLERRFEELGNHEYIVLTGYFHIVFSPTEVTRLQGMIPDQVTAVYGDVLGKGGHMTRSQREYYKSPLFVLDLLPDPLPRLARGEIPVGASLLAKGSAVTMKLWDRRFSGGSQGGGKQQVFGSVHAIPQKLAGQTGCNLPGASTNYKLLQGIFGDAQEVSKCVDVAYVNDVVQKVTRCIDSRSPSASKAYTARFQATGLSKTDFDAIMISGQKSCEIPEIPRHDVQTITGSQKKIFGIDPL